ncbi:MAG: protein kinase domain-containing protein [Phycisphaerae bacterium]
MSELDACPSIELLEAHLLGPPSVQIAGHLLRCPICRGALDRINADNAFLRGFAIGGALPSHTQVERPIDINIAGYEMVRELHAGGQGVVFLARQLSTNRSVAIKVMKQGPFATMADRQRFTREIETLARLDHPNIIAVHDAGTASGFHYFVMDYVEGLPLDRAVRHAEIWTAAAPTSDVDSAHDEEATRPTDATLRPILAMFVKICEAVHAAHLRGVMHRDLKPSNILIDAQGEPHVVDFGLAKPTDATADSAMTRTGQFVGSLPWASPEQVSGDAAHIDLRTDVYSLGAILYQILTGELPFDIGSNLRDAIDNILTREAPRPSARASTTGTHVNDELDTIVLKCLSKDRDRRYQSAGDLARDLSRYLAGEPIEAKRDSALYLLRKNLRRYRQSLVIGAAFVVLLTVVSISMTLLYRRSTQLEQQAVRSAGALAASLSESTINQGRMAGLLGNFEQAERLLWPEFLFDRSRDAGSATRLLEPPGGIEPYWALWELYRVRPCAQTVVPLPIESRYFILDAVGGFWTVNRAGLVSRYDATGRVVDSWTISRTVRWCRLYIDPSGSHVVERYVDGIDIQRRIAGTDRAERLLVEPTRCSAISRTASLYAVIDDSDIVIQRISPRSDVVRIAVPAGGVDTLAFSNDETMLAARSPTGALRVWKIDDGREIFATPARHAKDDVLQPGGDLMFCPDDSRLIDLWMESPGGVWDLRTNTPSLVPFSERAGDGRFAASTADGTLVAVGDIRGVVRLFDGATGSKIQSFIAHRRMITGLAMTPDGRGLWTAGNGEIRLWELQPDPAVIVTRADGDTLFAVAFKNAERTILSGGRLSRVISVDRKTRAISSFDTGTSAVIASIDVSPREGAIAATTYGRESLLWPDGRLDQPPLLIAHPTKQSHLAFSPDGETLATACDDQIVRLWSARDGTPLRELPAVRDRVPQLAFSPDGKRLAGAIRNGELLVWTLATGAAQSWHMTLGLPMRTVRFSSDGRWLAAAGAARVVMIFDAVTGTQVDSLAGHSQEIYCLDISADGQLIASGDSGGGLRLWHLPTRRPLASLDGHTDAVMAVKFCDDGNTLVSASLDGTMREWNLRYFDRHIAGQVAAQLIRNDASEGPQADAWRKWAEGVLEKSRAK